MAFDPKTARPIKSSGFDLSTASPIGEERGVSIEELQRREEPRFLGLDFPGSRQISSVAERPGAAVRSAILGRGYESGAVHPENVPSFSEISREMIPEQGTPGRALLDVFPSPIPPFKLPQFAQGVGIAGDIATNPFDLLTSLIGGTATGRQIASSTVKGVGKAVTYPSKVIQRGQMSRKGIKAAPDMIDDLLGFFEKRKLSDKRASLRSLRQQINQLSNDEIRNLTGVNKAQFQSTLDELENFSRESVTNIREVLPSKVGERSRIYSGRLYSLADKSGKNLDRVTTRGEVYSRIRNIAQENRLIGEPFPQPPRSPVEGRVIELVEDFSDVRRFNEPVSYEELKRVRNEVWKRIPGSMRGGTSPYTADEHIISSFDEDFAGFLEQVLPGVKTLNKEYAPFIRFKRDAFRVFSPGRSLGGKSGVSLIRRVGKGQATGEEEAFLKTLEDELGLPLTGKPSQIRASLKSYKEQARQIKPTVEAQRSSRLENVKAMVEGATESYRQVESQLFKEKGLAEKDLLKFERGEKIKKAIGVGVGAATVGRPVAKFLFDLFGVGNLLGGGE